jgi:WD40 repeat protein
VDKGLIHSVTFLVATVFTTACVDRNFMRAEHIIDAAHGGGSVVEISANSELGASGGWEGGIKLWQLAKGKRLHGWQAHRGEVKGLLFYDRDSKLLSAGFDGRLAKWNLRGELLQEQQSDSPVTQIRADRDSNLIVTGHLNGEVGFWTFDTLRRVRTEKPHSDWVRAMALEPRSRRLATGDADGAVLLWNDLADPKPLAKLGRDMRTLVFTNDGALIGGSWFNLYRWDLESGQMTELETEHGGIINSLVFSSDGSRLYSISRQTDSAVLALDPHSGQTLQRFQSHALCGAAVAVSSNGRYLLSTSDDASVRIWNLP